MLMNEATQSINNPKKKLQMLNIDAGSAAAFNYITQAPRKIYSKFEVGVFAQPLSEISIIRNPIGFINLFFLLLERSNNHKTNKSNIVRASSRTD